MQSQPFGILRISNNNPRQPVKPPLKQGNSGQQSQLFQAVPVTNHTSQTFTRDAHPLHCTNESEQTLPSRVNDIDNDDNDMFTDTSQTPQGKAKMKEKKEHLWQLCCN